MSSCEAVIADAVATAAEPPASDAQELARLLTDVLQRGGAADFPDRALQEIFTAAIEIYAQKHECGQHLPPLAMDRLPSATSVLVATTAVLKSANLELFELGMWQSWSGSR
jgi:hypothetical protein